MLAAKALVKLEEIAIIQMICTCMHICMDTQHTLILRHMCVHTEAYIIMRMDTNTQELAYWLTLE